MADLWTAFTELWSLAWAHPGEYVVIFILILLVLLFIFGATGADIGAYIVLGSIFVAAILSVFALKALVGWGIVKEVSILLQVLPS